MCVLASFPASTAEHGLEMRLTQYVLGITFVTSYRPVASLVWMCGGEFGAWIQRLCTAKKLCKAWKKFLAIVFGHEQELS